MHGELAKAHILILKTSPRDRGDKSIELLLLVANLVLFDDNVASKVLEEIVSKIVSLVFILVVISVKGTSLFVRSLAGVDSIIKLLQLVFLEIIDLLEVDVIRSLFLLFSSRTVKFGLIVQLVNFVLDDTSFNS